MPLMNFSAFSCLCQYEGRSLVGERLADRGADTAGAAGDQGDPVRDQAVVAVVGRAGLGG
jgi:hypothetical protein